MGLFEPMEGGATQSRSGDEGSSTCHEFQLPSGVAALVARQLACTSPDPRAACLDVASMCCACRGWREACRDVGPGFVLALDGRDDPYCRHRNRRRLRGLGAEQKKAAFAAVARVLRGYTEVSLAGDCITDALLIQISDRSAGRLTSVSITSTRGVTDGGLSTVAVSCPHLRHIRLEDIRSPEPSIGGFLPVLVQSCPLLQEVRLAALRTCDLVPTMDLLEESRALWRAKGIRNLHLTGLGEDMQLGWLWDNVPALERLEIDGAPENVVDAAGSCPQIVHLSYVVTDSDTVTGILVALQHLPRLQSLEFLLKGCRIRKDDARLAGTLNLHRLSIDAYHYKCHGCVGRPVTSHVDNDSVKALVEGVRCRWFQRNREDRRYGLSLCGATSLGHDAVTALLRLPVLTDLDISGCARVGSMDKMRLSAKVKAGRQSSKPGARHSCDFSDRPSPERPFPGTS